MIQISTDKKKLDIDLIHKYLSKESYWAKGRDIEIVKRSIDNSLCFGLYISNKQIGFARVVSDYSVFAWIMDVFILKNYRGKGYGKKLMKVIMTHKKLQNLQRWGLGTDDAHGLYEQFGFKLLSKPENMMEIKLK
ncbi:GNAT family N-acetyltransferase [Abyssalbus ytuae]|uniref:GNAT family N-acetyltransferase n=1 Tax=Abyssalbus ytuae TaxID=2926907 RepID=A0A9E6ZYI8_9FLAO|nr:GNAT family N-acetyltransferase [Abyssalbus ytuae]UOB17557.1 GNAT family N-acetyltransferase [Abyssalbus ytuae]